MEIVRLIQAQFIMWDVDLIGPSGKQMVVKNSNLNEDLGAVSEFFVLSRPQPEGDHKGKRKWSKSILTPIFFKLPFRLFLVIALRLIISFQIRLERSQ
jgi:hypothetical protein